MKPDTADPLRPLLEAARTLPAVGAASRVLTGRRLMETLRRERSRSRWWPRGWRPSRPALLISVALVSAAFGAVLHATASRRALPTSPIPAEAAVAVARTRAPAAAAAATPQEHALLAEAMSRLYRDRDAAGALASLDAHARLGRTVLVPEATGVAVDALLSLGRKREALARLDAVDLRSLPRSAERQALRGELRAAGGRCPDAIADFDAVLSRVGADATFERALYGRALCRQRSGDRVGAVADLRQIVRLFPRGRFAAAAAAALDADRSREAP